ncbi:hypothetical protein BHM03_00032343 [Ensete ventricosum]|nr:hypothetical protein BHM03_00032343 [Ensete ventricosum]
MLLLRPNPHPSIVTAQARTRGSLPPFLSFFSLRLPSHSLPAPSPLFSTQPRRPHCLPPPACGADVGDQDDGFDEELRRLLVLLPLEMRRRAEAHPELRRLVEIVMDLGRRPLARFPSGDFFLSDCPISPQDLLHAASQVGDFAADNRAGISRTLHRISAIRNRKGSIVGLTCRVGRSVTGSANLLRDLVKDGGSLLLIGPPGVGKTTVIRFHIHLFPNHDYKKRVMIVDTSNEIGGDGDIPHAGIGSARRLILIKFVRLHVHQVLIEAVENHMPQVIVIDEIGTKLEALAASTIAQRGIQLVATAHGVTIENLIMNPSLEMLVGGIQVCDEEASRRGVQKTVLERKGPSTFTFGAEIVSKTEVRSTSLVQITKAVRALVDEHANVSKYHKAEQEATSSEMVDAIELLARPPHIILVQIDLIKKYKLKWEMVGQEPGVYLRIFALTVQAGIGEKKSVDQVVDENIELDDLTSFGGTEESSQSGVRYVLLRRKSRLNAVHCA